MDLNLDMLWSGIKQAAEKAGELAKDVVTAGGYSSLNKSVAAYEVKFREHSNSIQHFKDANANFRFAVETLGLETSDCISLLKDAKDFVERLSDSKCSSNIPSLPRFKSPDLSHVTATLADFDAAITAGKGAGIGIAASTGAWILVAHLGTASTGAAIAGLGGIAAQNAILAWFGGGALAAGGGGMILGGMVVGAIVLLPLVGYSAFKSYKEASRIDEEAIKVEESAKFNFQNATKLDELKTSANTLRDEIAEERESFTNEFMTMRSDALKLAEVTAASANSFADKLIFIAKTKGATA